MLTFQWEMNIINLDVAAGSGATDLVSGRKLFYSQVFCWRASWQYSCWYAVIYRPIQIDNKDCTNVLCMFKAPTAKRQMNRLIHQLVTCCVSFSYVSTPIEHCNILSEPFTVLLFYCSWWHWRTGHTHWSRACARYFMLEYCCVARFLEHFC